MKNVQINNSDKKFLGVIKELEKMQEKLIKALFISMFCFCSASVGYFTHTIIDYVSNPNPSFGQEMRYRQVRVYNSNNGVISPEEEGNRRYPPMRPHDMGAVAAVTSKQAPSKANNVRDDEHLLNPLIEESIEEFDENVSRMRSSRNRQNGNSNFDRKR